MFIHVPRTGGTSIEHALFPGHAFDDGPADTEHLFGLDDRGRWLQHLTASEIVEHRFLTPAEFRDTLTFSVLRNPWDRAVSSYAWKFRSSGMPFDEFASRLAEGDPMIFDAYHSPVAARQHLRPQTDYFVADDEVVVDHVLRFEDLHAEFARIGAAIRSVAPLAHLNGSVRGDYRAYYDPTTRRLIGRHYEQDIDFGRYLFERDDVRLLGSRRAAHQRRA